MAPAQRIEVKIAERSSHPTSGRRRKVKGPPSMLPALHHRLDTSSDEAARKKAELGKSLSF